MNPKTNGTTSSHNEIEDNKVVMHLASGRLLKGNLLDFTPNSPTVRLKLQKDSDLMEIGVGEVKAIFYVKSFSGNKDYREKRQFGLVGSKGKRIMVRFKDGEILLGFSEIELSSKGGSLSTLAGLDQKGFFIFPADPKSNNVKIFVITSSLVDARYL